MTLWYFQNVKEKSKYFDYRDKSYLHAWEGKDTQRPLVVKQPLEGAESLYGRVSSRFERCFRHVCCMINSPFLLVPLMALEPEKVFVMTGSVPFPVSHFRLD